MTTAEEQHLGERVTAIEEVLPKLATKEDIQNLNRDLKNLEGAQESRLYTKISELEGRLNKKMDGMETRLMAAISRNGSKSE